MMKTIYVLLFTGLFAYQSAFSQHAAWHDQMQDNKVNFYEVQENFELYWGNRVYERGKGFRQYKRWEWFAAPRVFPSGERPVYSHAWQERKLFDQNYPSGELRNQTWQPLGPTSWSAISSGYNPGIGRVNFIVEDPNNSQIVYIGAPAGGLWKTTNGGNSWQPLTDDFMSLGVTGIAINPSNSQEIYIATGDGFASDSYSVGVFKSLDGGETWQPTGMSQQITDFVRSRRLVMHPTDFNTLLLATNTGLFKTVDGGSNWQQVRTGNFRDVVYHPTDHNIVYASTNRLFRSTDGGDNFNAITGGLPSPTQLNRMEIAVSPDAPDRVYVVAGKSSDHGLHGVYRSDDAGLSFPTVFNSKNLFGYSELGDDQGGQSWFDMAIAVNPNNADHIFIGGVNVWESTNGAQDFTINSHWVFPTTFNYTHADIHALVFYGNRLYCGSDGGVFVSHDEGSSFLDLSEGLQIGQFYSIDGASYDANRIIGGTQDNGSKLKLSPNDWVHIMGADGMQAKFHPTNPNVMYCTQQFGNLHRSTNGGNNWEYIFNGDFEDGNWVTPFEMKSNGDLLIGYESIWLSQNNGASFNVHSAPLVSGSSINCIEISKSNENTIYASVENQVFRTSNDGVDWSNITNNLPNLFVTDIEVHPHNPNVVYVAFSGYSATEKLFVSTDGGQNWMNISNNLPNLPANALAFQANSNGGLYVGMDVGIYYIDSTLSSFVAYDEDLPNAPISDLVIHEGTSHIKAATFGRGVWVADLFTVPEVPPVASFITSSLSNVCMNDSVSFFDQSQYGGNRFWSFPGGFPTTSALQNPKVYFPSSGVYHVMLISTNAFGTDTLIQSIEINMGEGALSIALQTDNYPSETSWEILDDQGNSVLQGGNYNSANTLFTQNVCLDTGCYVFHIYDEWGDGICCGEGEGFYELTLNGDVIILGGEFTFQQSYPFCVESSLSLSEHNMISFIDVLLYPNPTTNILNIEPSEETLEYDFVLFDAMGKLVQNYQGMKGKQTISLSNLSLGTYFINIDFGSSVVRKKVEVMR